MTIQALVIDVEVSSLDTLEVIQLAYSPPGSSGGLSKNYKPSGEMSLGALATHHILPSDLHGCEPSANAASQLPACEYVVGHNVDFDADCLGGLPGVKRICTLAMARSVWPELDCHKLTALAYHVLGANEQTRDLVRGAHDAGVDVRITGIVLDAIIKHKGLSSGGDRDWKRIYAFSEEARIPTVMTFGKHRGTKIEDVPADYVRWLLKQNDVDPYMRKAFAR